MQTRFSGHWFVEGAEMMLNTKFGANQQTILKLLNFSKFQYGVDGHLGFRKYFIAQHVHVGRSRG